MNTPPDALSEQIPTSPDTTKKGNSLTAEFIMKQYQRSTSALRKQQYEYVKNMAFLDGQQWLQYNYTLNRWSKLPADPTRTRVTFNILRSSVRILMSKALSRELVFEVPPADSDSSSVRGAQLGEAILYDLHCEHNWENLRADAAISSFIGGTSILASDWNAKAGTTIGHLPITGEAFGTGELEETCLSILEVAWEPGVKIAEKGYWWARAQALPPAMVRQTYNLQEDPEADVRGISTPMATLMAQQNLGSDQPELTLVITYYERPNPSRPKGAICTVINNKIVGNVVDWYFPFKDHLNMVTVRESKVPGQAVGETVFSDACRIQVAYNDAWSNLLEHHKNAGNARMLVPEGSLDGVEDISDLPAEILPFNEQSGKPEWMSPPVMPSWWMQGVDKLRAELDDILSIHDVSRGQAPTNVDSGVGLSILVEQDNTPIGSLTRELAYAFERLGQMSLEIYSQKVTETRKAKINRDVHPESVEWTGRSLSGQVTPNIPIDAIMPRSHAADLANAKYMWDAKLISDPRDFIRFAQQPGYKNLLDVVDTDADKAERENHLMSLDNICIPADFDDHRRHIEVHNRYRKSTSYESLSEEARSIVDDHILAHERIAAEQAAEQEAKLMVSQGLAQVPTAAAQEPILPPPPHVMPPQGSEGPLDGKLQQPNPFMK